MGPGTCRHFEGQERWNSRQWRWKDNFDHRKGHRNVEERWNELKVSIVRSAEEHLQRKKTAQKAWITVETLDLVEANTKAFSRWQEHRRDVRRREEYVDLCKKVSRAMRRDKETGWME